MEKQKQFTFAWGYDIGAVNRKKMSIGGTRYSSILGYGSIKRNDLKTEYRNAEYFLKVIENPLCFLI